jgi:hypothetical protein
MATQKAIPNRFGPRPAPTRSLCSTQPDQRMDAASEREASAKGTSGRKIAIQWLCYGNYQGE